MTESTVRERSSNAIAAIAMVITWSAGFIGAELGTRAGGTPFMLLSWRMYVLSAVLLIVILVRKAGWPDRSSWKRSGIVAVFSQVGYLTLIFEGVFHGVHGGTSALIAGLQPLLVATVASRVLGERTTPVMWLGMVIGFIGVSVVVSNEIHAGNAPLSAYLYPTIGMLCLAIGTVLSRKLKSHETLLQATFMQAVVTGTILGVLALVAGEAAPLTTGDFWRSIAWMVIVPSLGGYVMYMYVTHHMGATTVSTLLYLTPPTTMLWVAVMFGEPITSATLVGMVISGVGVGLVLQARLRR